MDKEWKPINGEEPEEDALKAIKYPNNCFVDAGPGAGKSALLIQKANYLFSTCLNNNYQKILAISFTRSAAKNLTNRVNQLFPDYMSSKFVSTTFDAFCINLYLQFKKSLPTQFITTDIFDIDLNAEYNFGNEFENFCTEKIKSNYEIAPDYKTYIKPALLDNTLEYIKDSGKKELLIKYIEYKVSNNELTFEITKQLAFLIIKNNPQIKFCIQKTYPYVFVDEFQDTNNIQYCLLNELFNSENVNVTCVGDKKQSIYSYNGANTNLIDFFVKYFNAKVFTLKNNYRSQKEIVRLVNTLGKEIDISMEPAISMVKDTVDKELIFIRLDSPDKEKVYVYKKIKKLLDNGIKPREIAILGTRLIGDLTKHIVNYLQTQGIKVRIEDNYSLFLEDDFFNFCFSLIIIALDRNINAFNFVIEIYQKLYGSDFNYLLLNEDLINLKKYLNNCNDFEKIIYYIIDYYNLKQNQNFSSLTMTSKFESNIKKLRLILNFHYQTTNELLNSIKDLYGEDTIPVITIHKSKGLQYDTIFFIGLENSQYWNLANKPEEERVIFVAISRAKNNIYITCGNWRDRRKKYYNEYLENIINKLSENGLQRRKWVD